MRRDRAGSAIAARDAGLRRVTRLTWQVAAAGAVCSALIAAAFGHGTSQQSASQRGDQPAQHEPATGPAPARPSGPATRVLASTVVATTASTVAPDW